MSEPNPAQWDDERARRWIQNARTREAQLEPVSDWLFEAAALQPGDRVLDVGCGTGPTTARAAGEVTDSGRVTGLDISPAMIEVAAQRVADPQVDWLTADAASYAFEPGSYDVVISRFGTMFFADAAAAFANLARATRPDGRLHLAVWRRRTECPFFQVPYETVTSTLDRLGTAHPDLDPDQIMFSLGLPDVVQPLLEAAGWGEVAVTPHEEHLYLGGPGEIEMITEVALEHGPVRELLDGQPADVLAAVRDDLRQLVVDRHDGTGVPLPAGVLIISARRINRLA